MSPNLYQLIDTKYQAINNISLAKKPYKARQLEIPIHSKALAKAIIDVVKHE